MVPLWIHSGSIEFTSRIGPMHAACPAQVRQVLHLIEHYNLTLEGDR